MYHFSAICRSMLALGCIIMLCGCRQASPETKAGELAAHRWEMADTSVSGRIDIDGDIFTLSGVAEGTENVSLSGKYFADDETITVETEDQGTVRLSYDINNEKLILTYYGNELTFFRAEEDKEDQSLASVVQNS